MGYIEKNLIPEETVLYKTRLHWIVLIWPLVGGVVLWGVGLVFVVGGYEASGKGSSYPGMIIVGLLLNRKSIEVLLPKIESIGVDESGLGRMLGYGSVIVRGTGGTFETFGRIAHPNELRQQVQRQIGDEAS